MANLNRNGEKRNPRRSVVLPAVLILLGVLLLLNNLGLMNWSVRTAIIRFWPLILIALGLELILGRGSVSISLIVIIILVIIVGSGLALRHPTARWATTRTKIQKPLSGATSADIEIKMGVGALYLGSLANSSDLISGTVDTTAGEWLTQDFKITENKARLLLATESRNILDRRFFGIGKQPARTWDLALTETIPINLDIRTGVGEASINLERIMATYIKIETGVGKTNLTLPATGNAKVTLSGGVGETVIHVPKGVAAHIRTKTGIGSVQVYGNYLRVNNEYISPDFDTAENRVELEVKGGVGSIVIQG
ncbi:MAG TPA: DUF5668 domain-containing protein [Bacillota bacterium]|mgnify:CR=1 FL=1|nr:DUF5668 domain-containing protein [Bacillota bacterium]